MVCTFLRLNNNYCSHFHSRAFRDSQASLVSDFAAFKFFLRENFKIQLKRILENFK